MRGINGSNDQPDAKPHGQPDAQPHGQPDAQPHGQHAAPCRHLDRNGHRRAGDPHVYGQRFDINQPGKHQLIRTPMLARLKISLLRLARATRTGRMSTSRTFGRGGVARQTSLGLPRLPSPATPCGTSSVMSARRWRGGSCPCEARARASEAGARTVLATAAAQCMVDTARCIYLSCFRCCRGPAPPGHRAV
ncbi:unnamed protein product [Prorocentrum cordatum]|uniref:Uncharacterized protein n=1 Tax=Prorocentrum cordatum TaxID=2364126 RepID=A0ABN9VGS2_9DINO|nr:unnamed protein product [Polarella glacialis]